METAAALLLSFFIVAILAVGWPIGFIRDSQVNFIKIFYRNAICK